MEERAPNEDEMMVLKDKNLDPNEWLVANSGPDFMKIKNKESGAVQVIDKFT